MKLIPWQIRLIPVLLVAPAVPLASGCVGSGRSASSQAPDREVINHGASADRAAAGHERPSSTDHHLRREVSATVAAFRSSEPALEPFFENCHGYAVFPTVGKGGFWIGGAHGKGEVYEGGRPIGRAAITQLTAGPQIGGQAYSEIIFFKDADTLHRFKRGSFELGAQVSAVALDEGGGRHAAYQDGVAIFTMTKKGLMAEATVAGQKFDFTPVDG